METNYQNVYTESIQEKEKFWLKQAQNLPWFTLPTDILSKNSLGNYQWFADGELNACYAAVDYWVEQGAGNQCAFIYDSPVTNTLEQITYADLQQRVAKTAGALQQLGVEKGDTVLIYMPMIPQTAIVMLACARIGAIHSVVFGGFAPHELAIRIDDAQPKVVVSASAGIEFDKIIPYKPFVDAAFQQASFQPDFHLIYNRKNVYSVQIAGEKEIDFADLVEKTPPVPCTKMKATDPLYILYTSGTTGKPKGIVRDIGGHLTMLKWTMSNLYGIEKGDVFWAASDFGWVVGHSYIVYAPLLAGCTSIIFEGKPIRTPDAGVFWRVIQQHKVKALFTAPTAFRAIRKEDNEAVLLKKYDISSLKYLFLAGERCDPSTLDWATRILQVPVIDHWWQTESGSPMLMNPIGIAYFPVKAGSAAFPVCGYEIEVLAENGEILPPNEEGYICVKLPLPPGCLPTLWNDDARFKQSYLSRFDGYYLSGDGGFKDEEGYFYIMGRVDDVINVSGHRLSTGEMEEMVAAHPAVAECAVVGIACQLRGQRPVGFVVLKDDVAILEVDLETQLVAYIREKIGAVAYFRNSLIINRLPKTRSGKILRKELRAIADGIDFTVPSTIDDPLILAEVEAALKRRQIGMAFELNNSDTI